LATDRPASASAQPAGQTQRQHEERPPRALSTATAPAKQQSDSATVHRLANGLPERPQQVKSELDSGGGNNNNDQR
jgi:hypothetical protein